MPLSQKIPNYKQIKKIFLEIKIKSFLHCTGALIFLDFMVCEIVHFDYNNATACILIHFCTHAKAISIHACT